MDSPTRITVDSKQADKLPDTVQNALRKKVKPALVADPFWGDKIRRELWPKRYKHLPNLFRFELPDAHRGVYSALTYPGQPREIRIVWLGNHKQYDRLFGYHTS